MRTWLLLVLSLIVVMGSVTLLADEPKTAPVPSNPAFEKFKDLAGDWEGKGEDGKIFTTSFKVVSRGSAVMINEAQENMVTMVHPDGKVLIATHYCAAQNQPRFVSVPSDNPNVIVFKFKDITNLSSPEAGHMIGVVFTIVDADHYTESWTWREAGKEKYFTFQLSRKKS